MKRQALLALLLVLFQPRPSSLPAQEVQSAAHDSQSPGTTLRSATNLVLVDVVARKNGLPDKTLKREDFTLFDNDHPVAIKTFDSGAEAAARPLALWFVVQCTMVGWTNQGSGLFRGQIGRFQPALRNVDPHDAVAVAHWCDNGDAKIDLRPTSNTEELVTALENVLAPTFNPEGHGREGELALQKTLQLIVNATRSLVPEPLPVVIFLYGDYSGMPKSEADHFVDALLETSALAYGLKDKRSPRIWLVGELGAVAHYIALETGGEYLWVTPETYAQSLTEILQQLHFRYELGFKAETLDGKRHRLRVELMHTAKSSHKGTRLRYRLAYVPVPQEN